MNKGQIYQKNNKKDSQLKNQRLFLPLIKKFNCDKVLQNLVRKKDRRIKK